VPPDRAVPAQLSEHVCPGSTILRRALRLGLYAALGWVGFYLLVIPLAGYLSYLAAFMFPLVVVLEVVGFARAVTSRGRWAWVYLLGNTGMLVATGVVFVEGLVELSVHQQPDTRVTAPLYLALVVLGLVVGVVAGARMRRPAP